MLQPAFISLLSLLLCACATTGVQTRALLDAPPDIAGRVELTQVPFIPQSKEGYCGPSSLAMVMRFARKDISVETLASEIYRADKKGSLQAELMAASRQRGLLAVQIDGLANLLKEIAAGHPVIVFENLGLSWLPQWHYSVVVGYDLDQQEVIRHSGDDAFTHQSLNHFERSWKLAEYWGLVVIPTTDLATGATEVAHLQGAVGLERAGHVREAEQVYWNILKRWPSSLGALIGLGNLTYQSGRYAEAAAHLKKAVKAHPEAPTAIHNLKVAERAVRRSSYFAGRERFSSP